MKEKEIEKNLKEIRKSLEALGRGLALILHSVGFDEGDDSEPESKLQKSKTSHSKLSVEFPNKYIG